VGALDIISFMLDESWVFNSSSLSLTYSSKSFFINFDSEIKVYISDFETNPNPVYVWWGTLTDHLAMNSIGSLFVAPAGITLNGSAFFPDT